MNEQRHHKCDLAIVGANYAGLTMALATAHSLPTGIRIALLDRAALPNPDEVSTEGDIRATAITAASRNMLIRLGVWRHLEENAQPMTEIDLTDSPLEAAVRPVLLHYENRTEDDDPASWMVENAALKRALLAEVHDRSAIEVLAPTQVIELEESGAATRALKTSTGRIEAHLIIAADGRRSFIRNAAGIKVVSWSYPQKGIVTTVAHERPHKGKAIQHFLPSGPFAILPLKGNRSSLVWTEDADEADRIMQLDDASFLEELTKRFGPKLGPLDLASARASWPLDTTLARSMVADRVALVGDAAHGVHPIAGQGLNIAFADIAGLVTCLQQSVSLGFGVGDTETLRKYETARRFDATRDAFAMDAINRLFSNDNALLRSVRDAGFAIVDRIPGLKRRIVDNAAGLSERTPPLCAPIE